MLFRMKYSKTTEGRFLSHLDLLRNMERSFRRARLPLAFSEGFNPHPKISYGSALAVGVTSDGEYLDVEFNREVSLSEIKERLDKALPPGIKMLEVIKLEGKNDSLMAIINMARYQVRLPLVKELSQEKLQQGIENLLAKKSLPITREGKKGTRELDIRPGIYDLSGDIEKDCLLLNMDLQTGSQGNVRPDEVIAEFIKYSGFLKEMISEEYPRIHRVGLFIRNEGKVQSPLE